MSRKCKVCREVYDPKNSFAVWCSPACGSVLGFQRLAKAKKQAGVIERRADKVKRDNSRPLSYWKAKAKVAIQQFRRLDELSMGSGCMSCGRTQEQVTGKDIWKPGGLWDGGHYLSKGARPELALEPLNIWLQCKSCNGGSSKYARKGYTVNASFRINLIERLGQEQVDWLEGPHPLRHDTADDLKTLTAHYNMLARELKENQE